VEREKAEIGKFSSGSDGSGNSVWDIVEFQVEENLGAGGCQLPN
jgi:hypothetical protein